jgi:hypothetical protein
LHVRLFGKSLDIIRIFNKEVPKPWKPLRATNFSLPFLNLFDNFTFFKLEKVFSELGIRVFFENRLRTRTLRSQKTEVRRRSNAIPQPTTHDVQTRSLNELWYETEEKIKKVTAHARNKEKKKLFDKKCAMVNEEKNYARAWTIQIPNRTRAAKNVNAMNEYKRPKWCSG